MKSIRNLTVLACVCVVLLAPGASLIASLWRGSAPNSALEGRGRPEMPAITLNGIAEGRVQAGLDAVLSFSAPHRDEALLAHAKWQRGLIRGAALVFGFDAMLTFYGSTLIHLRHLDQFMAMPRKESPKFGRRLQRAAGLYTDVMRAHPRIRWFFAAADTLTISEAGPGRFLVNRHLGYNVFREHLLSALPPASVIDLGYAGGEDIYSDFFRTDHHWRIQGAVRAYRRIAPVLGVEPLTFGPPAPVTAEEFFGSFARRGLATVRRGDAVFDVPYERTPLRVELYGTQSVPDFWLDRGYIGLPYKKESKYEDMYHGQFHDNIKQWRIINEHGGKGTLLIIGNSFGNCMERFFAEHYREVHRLDPRHLDITLADFLRSHHVDDVLFLFHAPGTVQKEVLTFLGSTDRRR